MFPPRKSANTPPSPLLTFRLNTLPPKNSSHIIPAEHNSSQVFLHSSTGGVVIRVES